LHNNAGVYALGIGDIPAARSHLEQAAQATQAIGQESYNVLTNLGWVRREESDLDRARSEFEAALRRSRRHGEAPGIGYASLGLACAQGMTLSVDDALQCARAPGAVTTEPPAGSTSLPATSAQQRSREVLVPKNCFLYAS
jgi:hypothetical protein